MKLTKLERAAIGITVLTLVVMGSYFWGTQRGAEPVTITAQQAAPPAVSAPAETAAAEASPAPEQTEDVFPIDLNTATVDELQLLPSIGEVRAQAIREVGNADVTITELTYDDAVRYSAKLAEENGWFLVQDTAWPGYEDVPTWIVQGYTTMLFEALDQLRDKGYDRPSHVFLQAGVGAMAGGVLGALQSVYGTALPCVSIVEPDHVACIYESVQQQDGATHPATGDNMTIMAGLNCGEVCQVTWPIMRDYADFCFACDDRVTARGMRVLAAPRDGDAQVISGESGAVTSGLVSLLLCDPAYAALRDQLKLDEHSVILLFSTEGDTDPAGWRNVVYNGAYPMAE